VAPIRVLIVDDVPESRDNIERLLRFEPDIQVVGKASKGQEGIELAVRLQPNVVLMDMTLPDMDGAQATLAVTAQAPGAGVIMLSVQSDPELLRQAMLAGAREFLVKPFRFEELVEAVRRVAQLARPVQVVTVASAPGMPAADTGPLGRDADVIAVLGTKGGVGRTFLATNLAIVLHRRSGKRVILVDTDLVFGDVAVMMNVTKAKTWLDVAQLGSSLDAELLGDILTEHSSGIQLLLAPFKPQDAEMVTTEHFQLAMRYLRRMADFVVIDTRPGFDELMLAVMDSADCLVYLLTMEMTAIKDTRHFLEVAELLGYRNKRLYLVLNRMNAYSGIPVGDIEENLKQELVARIVDDPAPVLRSVNEGTPFVEVQPEHRISAEIARLAAILAEQAAPVPEAPTREGRRRGFSWPRLGRRPA
jgi:pilus assembly protein CpaE